jgi:putative DNA primase/helicase
MQHSQISERAHGRWRSILLALGFDKAFLTGKHGPCPICGGDDRFRFDDKGEGSWICNKCGSAKGIRLVMDTRHLEFKEAARLIESVIGESEIDIRPDEPDAEQIMKSIRQLSARSKPVAEGDPVHQYLVSRLGRIEVPTCLRTVDSCIYKDKNASLSYHPAMIASVRAPDGSATALHRTYLTPDGQKAQVLSVRKVLGTLPDGAAVRLTEPAETMGIAEGIETALSASILFGIPTWAALNAGRLEKWVPPSGVTKVIVFADNDMNCAGQLAAFALVARLRKTIEAFVEMPPLLGSDWNDALHGQRSAA